MDGRHCVRLFFISRKDRSKNKKGGVKIEEETRPCNQLICCRNSIQKIYETCKEDEESYRNVGGNDMTKIKRFSVALVLTLILSMTMGSAVYAVTAGTTLSYGSFNANGSLVTDWNSNKGYAQTTSTSNTYPIGAYCNAYKKNGTYLGGKSITAYKNAKTEDVTGNATKYTSVHNIQNSSFKVLKSAKLSLEK